MVIDPAQHDEESPLREGAVLNGRYLVGRPLGEGGFGAVHEATHVHTGRRVAVKALHPHLLRHAQSRQRFLREARAATRIEHDHVVEVLDLDLDAASGVPFIVQELLVGDTLLDRLESLPGQRMDPADAVRLMVPVMEALAAAHARGVVHRDLKPNNIFLTRDRRGREVPKVIDFGIAKVLEEGGEAERTATGALIGTPTHMSPEQALGTPPIDAQTDVWAAGVVLYECLSGRLPYEAENVQQVLGMIQYREPVPLSERDPALPADLVAVVQGALQRERARRFPSMQAFLDALSGTATAAASLGADARPEAPRPAAPATQAPATPSVFESARTLTDRPPTATPPATSSDVTPPRPAPPRRRSGVVAAGLVLLSCAAAAASLRASSPRAAAPRAAATAQVTPAPAPPPRPVTPVAPAAPPEAAVRPEAPAAPREPPSSRAPAPRQGHAAHAVTRRPRPARSPVAPSAASLAPEVEWRP